MLGYLKRGEARHQRGELDAAADDFAAASAQDPTATRALELRGDVDLARQLPERAAEHYASCVKLDDRSPSVLYKLGSGADCSPVSHTEAADALTRAVALDNRLTEGHYLLGICLRELQRPRRRPTRARTRGRARPLVHCRARAARRALRAQPATAPA